MALKVERVVNSSMHVEKTLSRAADLNCTACGFWDTGLNPTQRWQQFEVASAELGWREEAVPLD